MVEICPVCNKKIGFLSGVTHQDGINVHETCIRTFSRNPEKYGGKPIEKTEAQIKAEVQRKEQQQKIENIKLTTAFTFNNHEIEDEIGIVTAECVFGMNVFRDFFAGVTDFFGGRSKASQKILRDARNSCLNELKLEAHSLGADGIIGIDLDYSEISGKGKGMLFLVASGTAVKFKQGDSRDG